jgi:hypothetical protein
LAGLIILLPPDKEDEDEDEYVEEEEFSSEEETETEDGSKIMVKCRSKTINRGTSLSIGACLACG